MEDKVFQIEIMEPETFEKKSVSIEYLQPHEIINQNLESYSSRELLILECVVILYVQSFLLSNEKNVLDTHKIAEFNIYFKWLSHCCGILADRIGQKILIYYKKGTPRIVRSSYNFCLKNTQCKNFYSKLSAPSCKDHHYVHSLLKYDIDSIVNYLDYTIEKNTTIIDDTYQNFCLSIKTLCYVLKHMEKELSYIDFITKGKSESFHRNNPVDIVNGNGRSFDKISNYAKIYGAVDKNDKKIINKNIFSPLLNYN